MSKKDKLTRCPQCNGELFIIEYIKDGAIVECNCGWHGVKRMKPQNRYNRKQDEIPDN